MKRKMLALTLVAVLFVGALTGCDMNRFLNDYLAETDTVSADTDESRAESYDASDTENVTEDGIESVTESSIEIGIEDVYEDGMEDRVPTEGFNYIQSEDGYHVMQVGDAMASEIVIPDTYQGHPVTGIEYYAFDGCTWMTKLYIPAGVKWIAPSAFVGCSELTRIYVSKDNPAYHVKGSCLIETATGTIILGCRNSVIPNDGSIKCIGWGAFLNCAELRDVQIPDGVTVIGDNAFTGCYGLTRMHLPDGVEIIEPAAFAVCRGLTEITIPDSVTSIGGGAFSHCIGLTEIFIPDRITRLEYGLFMGSTGLTEIRIPGGVTYIDENVFMDCHSLRKLDFQGTMAQWNAIEKHSAWCYDSPNFYIQCTDGALSKEGTLITNPELITPETVF